MCDVCIAGLALRATRCRSRKCMAYQDGAILANDDAPRIPWQNVPSLKFLIGSPGGTAMGKSLRPAPAIFVRATGKGPEFKPCRYQLRLDDQEWPEKWTYTKDLAGSMGLYGLDVKWRCKGRLVQDWVRGKRKCPTEQELRDEIGPVKPLSGEFEVGRIKKMAKRAR